MSLIKKGGVPTEKKPTDENQTPASPPARNPTDSLPSGTGTLPAQPTDGTGALPAAPTDGTESTESTESTKGGTTRGIGLPRLSQKRGAPSGNPPSAPPAAPTREGTDHFDPDQLDTRQSHTGTIQKAPSTAYKQATAAPLSPAGGTTRQRTMGARRGTGTSTHQRHRISEEHVLPDNTILQDRYVIEGVIGIGGMSVVYRGRDLRFRDVERMVAIKEMYQRSPDSQTRALSLQFFEREAGLLATLNHPAIPKIYDFFEEGQRVYLVLELIPGNDLEDVLQDHPSGIRETRVANWAVQICDVLIYLHSHQPEPIIFRDMKPSNIVLVDSDGNDRIVLVDFGIARLLDRSNRKGTMIGTEGYASPEQFRGIAEPVSDIYGLGATLHQILSGSDPREQTPFTFHERPLRMLNPQISPEMEAVVARALEYDMNARWGSAEEFKQALLSVPGVAQTITGQPTAPSINLLTNYQTSTELLWNFAAEEEIRSSPTCHSGLVFIGCYDSNLYAIDAKRGEFRWKYATEGGIASSPNVWNELVIIGSDDGVVYGIDIHRGQARWKFRTERSIRSSPRLFDRLVLIGSDDQHFYAIDGLRGTMIWKFRTWMPIRSSASTSEDSVFIGGNDNHVYCLDLKNGKMRWKQRTRGQVVSTPVFANGLVYVGSGDNNVYALDGAGGWPAWRYRTGHAVNSTPAVVGQRVFVGSADGHMYALDAKSGRLQWKHNTESQIVSSPFVDGGRVYFGAANGFVYCLDAGSGDLIWSYQTEGPVVSSPAVVDGVVYIGSLDNHLYALKA